MKAHDFLRRSFGSGKNESPVQFHPRWLIALAGALGILVPVAAFSQTEAGPMAPQNQPSYSAASGGESRTVPFTKRRSVFGGPGYATASVGAGLAGGLQDDHSMLSLLGGYNIDYTPLVTGKAFADVNIGTGNDTARFVDVAVGANYYPPQVQTNTGKPYVGGDLGVGFVRNDNDQTVNSIAVGGTAGFQFLAQQTNLDVGVRYEVLAAQLDGQTPQLLGLKLGMNF